MSRTFRITEEEINQAVLRSPYSLADSPSRQGMTSAQIKRYFYDFIRYLLERVNLRLGAIGTDFDIVYQNLADLADTDTMLGSAMNNNLNAHNESPSSHADIRKKITNDIYSHNAAKVAHMDIRDALKAVKDTASVAFSLASGRQRIYPLNDIIELCDLSFSELNVADTILFLDPGECDFIVYESGVSEATEYATNPNDIKITPTQIANGEISFTEGKIYYLNGTRLLATKGNMETSLLAKDEDLEALKTEFLENKEIVDASLLKINTELDTKETSLTKVESTEEIVLVSSHAEHNLGLRTSVGLEIDKSGEFDEAIVNFRAGETATSFDAPSSLYFAGDDCLDGRFYPNKNRIYEVNIKNVMGILIGRVGACDYLVVEA